jgi:hypothetical protein
MCRRAWGSPIPGVVNKIYPYAHGVVSANMLGGRYYVKPDKVFGNHPARLMSWWGAIVRE